MHRSLLALLATMVVAIATAGATAATGPPQNATRPSITGTAVVGKVFTARAGSWAGTLPISFKYQWMRCSSIGSGCVNISEAAQSQAYILTSDDHGHRLRVMVSASNSAGTTNQSSGASAIIRPAPANAPVNAVQPGISGSAIEGNTLTASNRSWNGATATYTYQWQRCDAAGAGCHNITDATGQTYTPTSLDVGGTLRVVVTATNSFGSGSSISHQTAAIRSASSVQVTLHSSAGVVMYGRSATLSGTVAGASAGDVVTIQARPGLTRSLQTVGTTTTTASGSFSKTVIPRLHTIYMARADGAQSDSVAINVRPVVRLSHIARHALAVRLTAAQSFVGRYVTMQAFVHGRWTKVKRVFLQHRSFGISPTIFSTASFRLAVRHGLKIRAFLTLSQSGPNYTSSRSNIVRS